MGKSCIATRVRAHYVTSKKERETYWLQSVSLFDWRHSKMLRANPVAYTVLHAPTSHARIFTCCGGDCLVWYFRAFVFAHHLQINSADRFHAQRSSPLADICSATRTL